VRVLEECNNIIVVVPRTRRPFETSSLVIVIVISILLKRYLKANRTRAPAYSRAQRRTKVFFQRWVKRSSGPISRGPEGDRVAVKVGVVQMGRVNLSITTSFFSTTSMHNLHI